MAFLVSVTLSSSSMAARRPMPRTCLPVVSAAFQEGHDILLRVPDGEYEYRNAAPFPNLDKHLASVHVRQIQVQKHNVRLGGDYLLDSLESGIGLEDFPSLACKSYGEKSSNTRFIIDHESPHPMLLRRSQGISLRSRNQGRFSLPRACRRGLRQFLCRWRAPGPDRLVYRRAFSRIS